MRGLNTTISNLLALGVVLGPPGFLDTNMFVSARVGGVEQRVRGVEQRVTFGVQSNAFGVQRADQCDAPM